MFINPTFRVYTNDDLVGVEIGGAVKHNSFSTGVCDGLGYGDNAGSPYDKRHAEIVRIE